MFQARRKNFAQIAAICTRAKCETGIEDARCESVAARERKVHISRAFVHVFIRPFLQGVVFAPILPTLTDILNEPACANRSYPVRLIVSAGHRRVAKVGGAIASN